MMLRVGIFCYTTWAPDFIVTRFRGSQISLEFADEIRSLEIRWSCSACSA